MENSNLLKTTRVVFSEEFASKIYTFSDKYCREHFKVFREKWNEWQIKNEKELNKEIQQIKTAGINNSIDEIKEKIYISARFYSRKRSKQQEKKQTQKQKQIQINNNDKKENIKLPPISKTIKQTIEEFIKSKLETYQENRHNQKKPIDLYNEYCETYIKEIAKEINRLRQTTKTTELDPQEISLKFKKAFHNYLYRNYGFK